MSFNLQLTLLFSLVAFQLVSSLVVPVNIIHITDVHGWVNGHPHEPNLDADFGDFTSFIEHLKANAQKNGEEFFLFDTGDILEGTGYSDASTPRGQYLLPIVQSVYNYDGMTMGNHDLEYSDVVDLFLDTFIPFWNENPSEPQRYITENQYYKPTDSPIGATYSYFTTESGVNVVVLGWLYNFTSNSDNTNVMSVDDSLEQPYIQEALSLPDIHMVVTVCHIDTSDTEMTDIYQTLRKQLPTTPLILLAGHRHITSFKTFDSNAFTIESGRYFEKLGVIKFMLDTSVPSMSQLKYQWMDTTRANFYNMTNTTEDTFLTPNGQVTKDLIAQATEILGLDIIYGCSPIYYDQHGSISDPTSLYNLYVDNIVPMVVFNDSLPNTQYFMTNTNTLRYNLYQGPVNRNDIYTISPFNDTYYYYPNMLGADLLSLVNTLGFYHTYLYIDVTAYYDVVAAEYDTQAISNKLAYFGLYYEDEIYPTRVNSTGALQVYIEEYMPCSADCPCPASVKQQTKKFTTQHTKRDGEFMILE